MAQEYINVIQVDLQGFAILVAATASAIVSVGTFIRAGKTQSRMSELEKNTNSMKDALVKAVGEKEYARGGLEERDKFGRDDIT